MKKIQVEGSIWLGVLVLAGTLILQSCGGGGNAGSSGGGIISNRWTWVSGSNVGGQRGVYGTPGVAAASNVPGAREGSVSWVDNSGKLWLLGGNGLDSVANGGLLNDLWKFDGSQWTWVSGSNVMAQSGMYGTSGVAAASNVPGARIAAVSWMDSSGKLWLFGGNGLDSAGTLGYLNDLWKFDGSQWTWISGSNITAQSAVYGTQNVATTGNVPGARSGAVSWVDNTGKLWLCGGYGYDAAGTLGFLNDLWKFDGSQWTWVSGSNVVNQNGVYGTRGIAASSNVPGARSGAVSWVDSTGKLWLFGGAGYDSTANGGFINDLWRFDGNQWTWVSGSNVVNQSGVYGTQGIAVTSNVPGVRGYSVNWTDSTGKLWLFGGYGHDAAGTLGFLNDLWNFNGSQWTWMSGSNLAAQSGVYGTQGVAATSNVPGARINSVSWVDRSGKLWLFGGYGFDSAGNQNDLNDLWSYQP